MIDRSRSEVWDALDQVIEHKYVLLNRAPTLHRLGIQAFLPVLIEGKAIQIHPLVCEAYNADFDGDQMAVHVPLSRMAQAEAEQIMLSKKNLLKPAAGEPVVKPRHEIILGIFWMTTEREGVKGEGRIFGSSEEAINFFELGTVHIQAKIKVRINDEIIETTIGRIIFNQILPEGIRYYNEPLNNKQQVAIVKECFDKFGSDVTTRVLDEMKDLGFKYSTFSGVSISMDDVQVPEQKEDILAETEKKVTEIRGQYEQGFITEDEKHNLSVESWQEARDQIQKQMEKQLDPWSFLTLAMNSGARGNISQITQLAGMKGNVQNAAGRIIELPIKSNYKEGLNSLEFFMSTHGTRKGFSDTALRTSDSGYLTRRLVDVAQDVIVTEADCGDKEGLLIKKSESKQIGEDFATRLITRFTAQKVVDPKTGEVIVPKNTLITEAVYAKIEASNVEEVTIRSILACKTKWGVCQKCYGTDLANGELIRMGTAVGIIAAQSIGEPGTQLTMRTTHTGGVVGVDITQGLPRVEELFEARAPKGEAVLAEIDGRVQVESKGRRKKIKVVSTAVEEEEYDITGYKAAVKNNSVVETKDVIATSEGKKPMRATATGVVRVRGNKMVLTKEADIREQEVPSGAHVMVPDGSEVTKGTQVTEGSWNLQKGLDLIGEAAIQRYITQETQKIYATQGQEIADKHIEVIIRQMFSRARIDDPGDTNFIIGEIVSRRRLMEENERAQKAKKQAAKYENLLLPITKVAGSTDSFLSAASFQETNRVLISASTEGKIDQLRGLKENVIIGKLIPVGTGYDPTLVTPAPLPAKPVVNLDTASERLEEGDLPKEILEELK